MMGADYREERDRVSDPASLPEVWKTFLAMKNPSVDVRREYGRERALEAGC